MSAPTLPQQVPAGLRVDRDSTNTRELTEGVKLVKTRKAWDTNTAKLLLGVGPNVHTRLVFLSAAIETCRGKLKRGVASRCGLENGIQELLGTGKLEYIIWVQAVLVSSCGPRNVR